MISKLETSLRSEMTGMKITKKPWLVGLYRGWETARLYRDYIKSQLLIIGFLMVPGCKRGGGVPGEP